MPPVLLQLPATVKAAEGAVSVPLLRVSEPERETGPVERWHHSCLARLSSPGSR